MTQSLVPTMLKIRNDLYAVFLKSLHKTRPVLQTILDLCTSPAHSTKENAELEVKRQDEENTRVQLFLDRVEKELRDPVERESLIALVGDLKLQFLESMAHSEVNMLPSYNHQLPSGNEKGMYLALDVGGTTFRVAVIELLGKNNAHRSRVVKRNDFEISRAIKNLMGVEFFDWIAEKVRKTVLDCKESFELGETLLDMGISWSFPIE
jgi:hexokinase